MNDYCADFLAVIVKIVNCFTNSFADRTHTNYDVFCFRCAVINEWFIFSSYDRRHFFHVICNNIRNSIIKFIASFASLEEHVRILSSSSCNRMIRIESFFSEFLNRIHIHKFCKFSIIYNFNLLNLVRSSETIEKMKERNTRFYCCKMGN